MAYSKMEVFDALSSSEMPMEEELQNIILNISLKQYAIILVKILECQKRNYFHSHTNSNQSGWIDIYFENVRIEQNIPDVVRSYLNMESSLEAEIIREKLFSLKH